VTRLGRLLISAVVVAGCASEGTEFSDASKPLVVDEMGCPVEVSEWGGAQGRPCADDGVSCGPKTAQGCPVPAGETRGGFRLECKNGVWEASIASLPCPAP
jgi:hypothetical protein